MSDRTVDAPRSDGTILVRWYVPTLAERAAETQGALTLEVVGRTRHEVPGRVYETVTLRPWVQQGGRDGAKIVAGPDLDFPAVDALTRAQVGQVFLVRAPDWRAEP